MEQREDISDAVHPHRRGERTYQRLDTDPDYGSSPQAWGTGDEWEDGWDIIRFIPTGVGNGPPPERAPCWVTVHPHRRGERPGGRSRFEKRIGSSPQAWGTEAFNQLQIENYRFIPTGVGNGSRFHPCVCVVRFIPTGVGNGDRSATPPPDSAVHPHRRGER